MISRLVGALICVVLVPGAFYLGWQRLTVETDLTTALPADDPVIDSARRILGHHPALDLVTIDITLEGSPSEASAKEGRAQRELLTLANKIQARLEASGLFDSVGTGDVAAAMPGLFGQVLDHLPQLFDAQELQTQVAPLLNPDSIRAALARNLAELAELDGLGQAEAFGRDPLRLRELVLARLAPLNPAQGARMLRGQIVSADGQHVLLVADPKGAGGDTVQARALMALLNDVAREVAPARLAVVGAFRSALDNETIVRADTQRAVWIATLGVALLLLLCFPRPWLGLLALIPALAGAALALFVYSLIEARISGLALGFGGALVAITVDHGIAYLQFLDRHRATTGRQAAREIWAVGLFASLTTVGAFLALYLTGYPMLGQVGLFAALGVGFSFLFVHTVFPLLFPRLRPASRKSLLPVGRLLSAIGRVRSWVCFGLALALAAGLAFFGRPDFVVDLNAMNTVKPETLAAEETVKRVWGDIFQRTYLLAEGPSLDALRAETDRLCGFLSAEQARGELESGFSPSQVLPGAERARANARAWTAFFDAERREALQRDLATASGDLFADDAFASFLATLTAPPVDPPAIPEGLLPLFGFSRAKDGGWLWLSAVQPGQAYRADAFAHRALDAGLGVFDPGLFTQRLSALLGDSFLNMLLIVGLAVVSLLALLFFDLLLVAVAILPLAFALAAALGAMKLLGHPLDIPGLMLAVVVLGMGVDYALFFVRGQQRYHDPADPNLGPIRMAVFLAGGSTLLGLGTLALSEHSVPKSAGMTTLLGVGFALLGTFVLLPPLLNRLFAPRPFPRAERRPGSAALARTVRGRYRHLDPGVRFFARFKLRLDPMFPRLAELVGEAATLIDVGCGRGLPAVWLLAQRAERRVFGLEPDPERARVARRAIGDAGEVIEAAAPDLGAAPGDADAALALDMIHHLDDAALAALLAGLHDHLRDGGRLILRATVPETAGAGWERRIEAFRLRLAGRKPRFRPLSDLATAVGAAGFRVLGSEATVPGRAEHWLWAERSAPPAAAAEEDA